MVEAGWYPDPENSANTRWWDGQSWTSHVRHPPPPAGSQPMSYQPPEPAPQQGVAGLFEQAKDSFLTHAKNPRSQGNAMAAGGGALIADGVVGFGKNRDGIFGAIGSVIVGIAWLIFSGFLLTGLGFGGAKDNEITTMGTITEVQQETWRDSDGDRNHGCSPTFSITHEGETYTKSSNTKVSPCQWDEGEAVEAHFDPTSPKSTMRLSMDKGAMAMFPVIFKGAGWLFIIGGIWTFIKRAGSVTAGIIILKKGLQRRKNNEPTE